MITLNNGLHNADMQQNSIRNKVSVGFDYEMMTSLSFGFLELLSKLENTIQPIACIYYQLYSFAHHIIKLHQTQYALPG